MPLLGQGQGCACVDALVSCESKQASKLRAAATHSGRELRLGGKTRASVPVRRVQEAYKRDGAENFNQN